jgi:hypothetical protein
MKFVNANKLYRKSGGTPHGTPGQVMRMWGTRHLLLVEGGGSSANIPLKPKYRLNGAPQPSLPVLGKAMFVDPRRLLQGGRCIGGLGQSRCRRTVLRSR